MGRSHITIPKGYISVATFPVSYENSAYSTCCNDFNCSVFIEYPDGKPRLLIDAAYRRQRASYADESWKDLNRKETMTPCVIERRTHHELSHHQANLLMPPGIDESSELFVPGMVVPDLRIKYVIGNKSEPKGFVLESSEYLGTEQEFYGPPVPALMANRNDRFVLFHGRVKEAIHKRFEEGKKQRPYVWIIGDSSTNGDAFDQNREQLRLVRSGAFPFWWEIPSEEINSGPEIKPHDFWY